jgi:hypothetical protein
MAATERSERRRTHSTPLSASTRAGATNTSPRLIFGTTSSSNACLRTCLAPGGLLAAGGGLLATGCLATLLCSVLVKDLVSSCLACGQSSNRACRTAGGWCGRETATDAGTQLHATCLSNSNCANPNTHHIKMLYAHCWFHPSPHIRCLQLLGYCRAASI